MEIRVSVVNGLSNAANNVAEFTDVVVDKTRLRSKLASLKNIIKKDKQKLHDAYANLGELYFDSAVNQVNYDDEKTDECCAEIIRLNERIKKAQSLYDELYDQYTETTFRKAEEKDEEKDFSDELDTSVFDNENFDRDYVKATVTKKSKDLSSKAKTTAQKALENAGELAQATKEVLSDVSQKAKEVASNLAGKALDTAQPLIEKTKQKAGRYSPAVDTSVVLDEGEFEYDSVIDETKEEIPSPVQTSEETVVQIEKPKRTTDESTEDFTF